MLTAWLNNDDFWQYSLRRYAEPNVAKQLLMLQDTYGANINLCLFCLYLETHQVALNQTQLLLLKKQLNVFGENFTQPLRNIRKALKVQYQSSEHYPTMRKQLLAAELAFEQQEQSILLSSLPLNDLIAANTVPNNLQIYLKALICVPKTDLDQILNLMCNT